MFWPGLSYSQAAANCKAGGGDLAQPTNDLESDTLTSVLSSSATDPNDSFWIGQSFVLLAKKKKTVVVQNKSSLLLYKHASITTIYKE
jgi:hypothetical protein